MTRSRSRRVSALAACFAFGCTSDGGRVSESARDASVVDAKTDAFDASAVCKAGCSGTCPDGRCLVVLAEAKAPANLVVDGTRMFFTTCDGTSGSVLSVPVGGGNVTTLATGGCPTGLARSGASLYVAGLAANALTSVPIDGGSANEFLAVSEAVQGLAADADAVYFTTATALSRATLVATAARSLATGHTAWTNLVVVDGTVFFGDRARGAVYAVPTSGGAATELASGLDTVSQIAVDVSNVYVASGYTVVAAPRAGGTAVTIGTAAGAEVVAITADSSGVYYASEGALWTVPPSGGAAVGLAANVGTVTTLVTDDASLYFADSRPCCGSVTKLTPK